MISPTISVVIPLYNKAQYIEKTINSVLNQTYDHFEIVIVDDGSTDESVNVIKKTFDSDKIRLSQKENGGPSSARNRGVLESKGDWIVFLDADDILLPNALEYFSNLILKVGNHVEYIICNYFIKTDHEIKLFSQAHIDRIVSNPFYLEAVRDLSERAGSAVMKRTLLLSHPFKEYLRRFEDAECQYEMMRSTKVYLSSVPVMITDRDATSAAGPRKNINEDFIGYLQFEGKSFWEQMSLYLLALECKIDYPEEAGRYDEVYHSRKYRMAYLYVRIRRRICNAFRRMIHHEENYTLEELLSLSSYGRFK